MKLAAPSAYFLYPIQWSTRPKLKRAWLTNVLTGMMGNEQRSKLKNNLVRTLTFTVITDGEEMTRHLKKQIRLYLPELWGVAVPQLRMKINQLALIGDSTIYVESTVGCELNHYYGVLVGRWNGFEYLTIASYTSNSITFRESLIDSWRPGAFVYPIMSCLLSDVQEFTQPTPYHFEGEFVFVENAVWESD
jgi:hypothetical protein